MQHRQMEAEKAFMISESLAVAAVKAIRTGNLLGLQRLLADNPKLARARLVDPRGVSRRLLHVVSDWPGHFRNGANTVAVLIKAGGTWSNGCVVMAPAEPVS